MKGTRVTLKCNRTGQVMSGKVIAYRKANLPKESQGLYLELSPDKWRWFNLTEWRQL